MNQYPMFVALPSENFHQFVDVAGFELVLVWRETGLAFQLFEFFVEELETLLKVDLFRGIWNKKRQEVGEYVL